MKNKIREVVDPRAARVEMAKLRHPGSASSARAAITCETKSAVGIGVGPDSPARCAYTHRNLYTSYLFSAVISSVNKESEPVQYFQGAIAYQWGLEQEGLGRENWRRSVAVIAMVDPCVCVQGASGETCRSRDPCSPVKYFQI